MSKVVKSGMTFVMKRSDDALVMMIGVCGAMWGMHRGCITCDLTLMMCEISSLTPEAAILC